MSKKTIELVEQRLAGAGDNFIRDARLFGLNHACKEFHLEDMPFTLVYDWAQQQTEEKLMSDRGLIRSPHEGDMRYMEDFLTVILKRFSDYEQKITKLEAENEQLKLAHQYHRSHPFDACNEMMDKIIGTKKDW